MGFIDIDDRDVFNYYETGIAGTPIAAKFKEWLGRLKAENLTARINNLGGGTFKIDLPVITCTGSDVQTLFNIPFMHIFEKMELKHVDSSDADSTDALTYSVSHQQYPNLWLIFLAVVNSIKADIVDEFVNYRHEQGQYLFITNSTNTDKLYIALYIKVTGE